MPSVAEQLREARERQKLSVHQVAEKTKIKSDHIRALEEGVYDAFPAPIYIRGFVRSYASVLHLDIARLMNDLEGELAQSERFRAPPGLGERERTVLDVLSLLVARIHWRTAAPLALVIVVGVLAVLAIRAWSRHAAIDPLSRLGPGLYQPRQTNSGGEVLPLPAPASPGRK